MGAGPSVMYATHALDAYAQFAGGVAGSKTDVDVARGARERRV
jgi:hypothetical protein